MPPNYYHSIHHLKVMYAVRARGIWFCNVHSEVGYELVLGTTWFGYELAWYDLVRVRVDRHPFEQYLVHVGVYIASVLFIV